MADIDRGHGPIIPYTPYTMIAGRRTMAANRAPSAWAVLSATPNDSQCMHVGQQILDLLIAHHAPEAFHLGAS